MTTDDHPAPNPDNRERLEREAHLLDLGNLAEVATWIATAAASGVVGSTTFEVLKAVRNRFGSDRVAELRERVYKEMQQVRRKHHLSNLDLQARVDRIFDDSQQ